MILSMPKMRKQPCKAGALAAGQDQSGQIFEILRLFDRPGSDIETFQVIQVFAHVPLEIQDADHLS